MKWIAGGVLATILAVVGVASTVSNGAVPSADLPDDKIESGTMRSPQTDSAPIPVPPAVSSAMKAEGSSELQAEAWEVCNNTEAGYAFKYPKGWFVYGRDQGNRYLFPEKETDCVGQTIKVAARKQTADMRFDARGALITNTDPMLVVQVIGANVRLRENAMSPHEYFRLIGREPAKVTTIGGEQAYWEIQSSDDNGVSANIYVKHGDLFLNLIPDSMPEWMLERLLASFVFAL